jgi:hypothetical protein
MAQLGRSQEGAAVVEELLKLESEQKCRVEHQSPGSLVRFGHNVQVR